LQFLLYGYLFLFIFRPYEYVPAIGEYHIERIYMILLILTTVLYGRKKFKPHILHLWIFSFLLVMVVSSLVSSNVDNALSATYDYAKLLVFYAIVTLVVNDEKELRNFILAYLVIMAVYVGKSSWEFFVHGRLTYHMGIPRLGGVDSTYGDPNAFAASIVYSFPFVWAVVKTESIKKSWKEFLLGYGILSLVAIAYTGSRSAMATLLLFGLMAAWKGKHKILSMIALCAMVAIGWTLLPEKYQLRLETVVTQKEVEEQKGAVASGQARFEELKHGLKVFKENIALGVGPNNFRYSWGGTEAGINAHNLYGQLLAELGITGGVVFLLLIIYTVSSNCRIVRTISKLKEKIPVTSDTGAHNLPEFMKNIATAGSQTILLLLFNGNFGHNLYRYNWLWIAAIAVTSQHALNSNLKKSTVHSTRSANAQ
jgi:O-antigen ligase